MTYGDGVCSGDIAASIAFHQAHGMLARMTAMQPRGRFGSLELKGDAITSFLEKPLGGAGWINGGFFVLSPKVIDRMAGDETTWEREPLESLARDQQLDAFRH